MPGLGGLLKKGLAQALPTNTLSAVTEGGPSSPAGRTRRSSTEAQEAAKQQRAPTMGSSIAALADMAKGEKSSEQRRELAQRGLVKLSDGLAGLLATSAPSSAERTTACSTRYDVALTISA